MCLMAITSEVGPITDQQAKNLPILKTMTPSASVEATTPSASASAEARRAMPSASSEAVSTSREVA